jgi:hypothetical protein
MNEHHNNREKNDCFPQMGQNAKDKKDTTSSYPLILLRVNCPYCAENAHRRKENTQGFWRE